MRAAGLGPGCGRARRGRGAVPVGAAIRGLGGFDLLSLPQQLLVTRSQLPGHIRALAETLLQLFGANGQGNHGLVFLAQWYDPGTRRANFVVAMENPDGPLGGIAVSAGQEFFGRPAQTYRVDGYVIMVYRYNLLTRLAHGSEHL